MTVGFFIKPTRGLGAAPSLVPTLPSWVPAENTLVNLTSSVTQRFYGQVASYYDPFYSRTILSDFSGGVFAPDWGTYGAVIVAGAGHSSSNDNSTMLLELRATDLAVKRIGDPTDFGQSPNNDLFNAPKNSRGEYTQDLKPAAFHSYDGMVLIRPGQGGAALGTVITPLRCALGHSGVSPDNTGQAHKFDLTSTTMSGAAWTRVSNATGFTTDIAPGSWAAYDSVRNRVWYGGNPSSPPAHIRYLDVATGDHTQISLSSAHPAMTVDSPCARYDASRDIIILSGSATSGSDVVLGWLNCASPAAGWASVTKSTTLPGAAENCAPFDLIPALNKYVMICQGATSSIFEFTLPATLTGTWTFTERTISGTTWPDWYVVGKKFCYAPAAKCFLFWHSAASGVDNIYAYRPVGV